MTMGVFKVLISDFELLEAAPLIAICFIFSFFERMLLPKWGQQWVGIVDHDHGGVQGVDFRFRAAGSGRRRGTGIFVNISQLKQGRGGVHGDSLSISALHLKLKVEVKWLTSIHIFAVCWIQLILYPQRPQVTNGPKRWGAFQEFSIIKTPFMEKKYNFATHNDPQGWHSMK